MASVADVFATVLFAFDAAVVETAFAGAFALTGTSTAPPVVFDVLAGPDFDTVAAEGLDAVAFFACNAFGAAFCLVAAAAFLNGADALRAAGAVDLAAVFVVRSWLFFTALLAFTEEALVDATLAGAFVGLDLAAADFVNVFLACVALGVARVVCVLAASLAPFGRTPEVEAVERFSEAVFADAFRATDSVLPVLAFTAAAFDRPAAPFALPVPAVFFCAATVSAAFFLGGMAHSLAVPLWTAGLAAHETAGALEELRYRAPDSRAAGSNFCGTSDGSDRKGSESGERRHAGPSP